MNFRHHIIHNFPPHYPLWKKILSNAIFFVGGMIIHHRKNLLNNLDFVKAVYNLKKGDTVLVGGLRRFSSLIIGRPFTHTLLYVGGRRFIHAIGDGVEYVSVHDIFCEYDTMLILRPKHLSKIELKKACMYAQQQIGKPYNFDFTMDEERFYCAELIAYAYKNAGYDCGIFEELKKRHSEVIRPSFFIEKKFKVVMKSHTLKEHHGEYTASC